MQAVAGHGLRPRSIGEILDLTFQIYRERFTVFAILGIGIGLMRLAVGIVWALLLFQVMDIPTADISAIDPDQLGVFLGFFLISVPVIFVVFLLVSALGAVAMTAAAEDAFLGRSAPLGSLLTRARGRVVMAACTSLLTSILSFAGTCLCCVPGIAAIIIWVLAVPLVYLERASIIGAMSRSWELVLRRGPTGLSTESNWVRIFVVGLITFLAYLILSFLGQLPVAALSVGSVLGSRQPIATILGPQPAPLVIMLPLQLLSAAIQGLFIPFLVIPWTLIYYDIRTRYEGLDLEQAAARLGGVPGPPGFRGFSSSGSVPPSSSAGESPSPGAEPTSSGSESSAGSPPSASPPEDLPR